MNQLSSRQKAIRNKIQEINVLIFDVCGIVAEYVYPKPFQMKLIKHMILSDISWQDQTVFGKVGNSHVQICEREEQMVDLKTGEANPFPLEEYNCEINLLGVIDGNLWYLKSDCHSTIFRRSAKNPIKGLTVPATPCGLTEHLNHFENLKWFKDALLWDFQSIKLIGCYEGFAFFAIHFSIVKVFIRTGLELNRFELPKKSSKFPMTITNDGMLVYWDVIDPNKKIAKLKKIDLLGLNRPAIEAEQGYECESLSDSEDENEAVINEGVQVGVNAEDSESENEVEFEAEENEGIKEGVNTEDSESENEVEVKAEQNEGLNEGSNEDTESEPESEDEKKEFFYKDYWPGSYLCVFSGDQEDEIWAVSDKCHVQKVSVFSSSTLKFLRFEKVDRPASASDFFAIENTLYAQTTVVQEEFDSPWATSKAWIREAMKHHDDDFVGMWVYE